MIRDPGNLLVSPAGAGPEEVTEVLAGSDVVRIERIVSNGQSSPPGFWYDQEEDEWVALLSGAATLTLRDPDETIELVPGDHLLIPAGRPHRVEWTSPERETIWLAVFYPRTGVGGRGQEETG
jgi:cupin 2 domain-containing protein